MSAACLLPEDPLLTGFALNRTEKQWLHSMKKRKIFAKNICKLRENSI